MIRFAQKSDYFKHLDALFFENFGINDSDIRGPWRKYPLVAYRHLYVYIMRVSGFQLKEIGKELSRHHSSIINSIARADDFIFLLKFDKKDIKKFKDIQNEMSRLRFDHRAES